MNTARSVFGVRLVRTKRKDVLTRRTLPARYERVYELQNIGCGRALSSLWRE